MEHPTRWLDLWPVQYPTSNNLLSLFSKATEPETTLSYHDPQWKDQYARAEITVACPLVWWAQVTMENFEGIGALARRGTDIYRHERGSATDPQHAPQGPGDQ